MPDPSRRARKLAAAIEPFAAQVYFAPECHERYTALGFAPSPRRSSSGVAFPDGPAYFCSRGSVMGQVPGEVVAAAFAVFDPAAVVPAVTFGWTLTDADTIERARTDGAVAHLTRLVGERPEGIERAADVLARAAGAVSVAGKPLFAGLSALTVPDTPLGAAWRHADRIREYRGDAHTAAWTSAGFDAIEIGILTELYWGLPAKSYVRTRAWSEDALDGAIARLEEAGLIAAGALTEDGRAAREAVEAATDRQCGPILDALADDLDALLTILIPLGAAIRAAGGYPSAGPHDLARR